MANPQEHIARELHRFKQRYILKRLLEGLVWLGVAGIGLWVLFSGLEAAAWFGTPVRAGMFFLYLAGTGAILFWRVGYPLYQLSRSDKAVDDETAARQVGRLLPAVGDKLLNYIQLRPATGNELARASLVQRARHLAGIPFGQAVVFDREKKQVLHYLLPVLLIAALALALWPQQLLPGTERLVRFHRTYAPQAPFRFVLPQHLVAYRNEDYTLEVRLQGEAVPQEAWLVSGPKRSRLLAAGSGLFSLHFPNITTDKVFHIEAGGFRSAEYRISVVDRPALGSFEVQLDYPSYLKLPPARLQNTGSFEAPEGTRLTWRIKALFTDSLAVSFDPGADTVIGQPAENDWFVFDKLLRQDFHYRLQLNNAWGRQQGKLVYQVKMIPDRPPQLDVQMLADTVLYRYLTLAGSLTDDHGLHSLRLVYRKNQEPEQHLSLPVDRGAVSQSFFHHWLLDSLRLAPGDRLDFYLLLSDNDAVNGYKTTRSQRFFLQVPDRQRAAEKLENNRDAVTRQLDRAATQAQNLKKRLDRLVDDLKGKKELSWQDEQRLQQLIEEKKKLEEKVEKLQQENRLLNERQKQLTDPPPEMLEKQEQLQELLDQLIDEETRQLYEELQKLLEEYEQTETVQNLLQQIQRKELNLEQELERAVEFLKQLQLEFKLQEASEQLQQLVEQQQNLQEQTADKHIPTDSLVDLQEKALSEFEKWQEKLREAEELNQELKRPNPMMPTSGEENAVKQEQKESKENLEKKNRKKSIQHQQNAINQMKRLGKKLSDMQSAMKMEQMQEDLANLQAILNNLIELSFDQEEVMKSFRSVKPSDPRFIGLSQEQLKIQEDSRIVNDSLLALAGRVMAISSFITRELNQMNGHLEASVEAIRERKTREALVSQQLAMTSINNLALMLDNVMQQMQEAMAGMGQGRQKDSQPQPGLSERQKKLNEQIRELAESGKTGRELSEELAKLAAEQERIRQALQEATEKYGGDEGKTRQLMQQMEQTETDLVNKRLTRQTLERQKQIETRLLEAEKAMREQELDPQREARSATQYDKILPEAFEEYMRQRARETELLKTVPPRLVPFFKEEVNRYFERLKQQQDYLNN